MSTINITEFVLAIPFFYRATLVIAEVVPCYNGKHNFKGLISLIGFGLNQFVFSMSILLYRISKQSNQLIMSNQSKRQIIVSTQNYELLRNFGRINSTFDDAVTHLLDNHRCPECRERSNKIMACRVIYQDSGGQIDNK